MLRARSLHNKLQALDDEASRRSVMLGTVAAHLCHGANADSRAAMRPC